MLSDGRMRFGDLRTAVEGISGKVLTETLRDLERDGLVDRHVYAEMPPRVEYELTALGRTLHVPLQALGLWAPRAHRRSAGGPRDVRRPHLRSGSGSPRLRTADRV